MAIISPLKDYINKCYKISSFCLTAVGNHLSIAATFCSGVWVRQ